MFDPVADRARRFHQKKRTEEEDIGEGTKKDITQRPRIIGYKCSMCGRVVKKLYASRCYSCHMRIAAAAHHHRR